MVMFMGDLALKPLYTISSKAVVTQTHGLQVDLLLEIKGVRFRMKESPSFIHCNLFHS